MTDPFPGVSRRTAAGRAASRRAPRLRADERIAGHLTRVGRFAKVDPRRGKSLPGWLRWIGFAGWALFLEESLRRARGARRDEN